MNKIRSFSIAIMVGFVLAVAQFAAPDAHATADSIVRNTSGMFAKRASDGKYYPSQLCYSTDGSQALIPCREGGAGVTPGYLDTSSTNVTSSAYVNVITSTSDAAKAVEIYNGSSAALSVATATASGAYTEKLLASASGWTPMMKLFIPAGASVAVKSKGSTVSSGLILIDLVQ